MGTSLCGMAADCVAEATAERHAAGQGQGLVIINLQSTPMDHAASLRLYGLIDPIMQMLAKELKLGKGATHQSRDGMAWEQQHRNCKYRTPKRKPTDPR